ncbi:MAG: acylphosphatase [Solirubrobacteraceae bacterium]
MARAADGMVRENHGVSEAVRKRVVVRGRVQGVFFRDSVRERARAHGVAGWACNRADGAVEVILEGAPEAVDRVVRFCETGPADARVEGTAVNEEEPEGVQGFEIR